MPERHFIFCLDTKNEAKKVKPAKEKSSRTAHLLSATE